MSDILDDDDDDDDANDVNISEIHAKNKPQSREKATDTVSAANTASSSTSTSVKSGMKKYGFRWFLFIGASLWRNHTDTRIGFPLCPVMHVCIISNRSVIRAYNKILLKHNNFCVVPV